MGSTVYLQGNICNNSFTIYDKKIKEAKNSQRFAENVTVHSFLFMFKNSHADDSNPKRSL